MRRVRIALTGLVTAVVLAGCADHVVDGVPSATACATGTDRAAAAATVHCYFRSIGRLDYTTTCSLLSERVQAQAAANALHRGTATCADSQRQAFALLSDEEKQTLTRLDASIRVDTVRVAGARATVDLAVRSVAKGTRTQVVHLVVERAAWRIDDSPK